MHNNDSTLISCICHSNSVYIQAIDFYYEKTTGIRVQTYET